MKMLVKKNERVMQYAFWTIVIILTFVRVSLFLDIPLIVLGNSPHDDQLLITIGDSLSKGEWLGTYDNRTLAKGISFPLYFSLQECLYVNSLSQ